MKINNLSIKEILDSRSEPTIEVGLENSKEEIFKASIPSGKSLGSNEAAVISPQQAEKVLEEIRGIILDKNFNSVAALDEFLIRLDGTRNKKRLGGNLILGISIAFARSLAKEKNQELWEYLNGEFFAGENFKEKPKIFSNLINGGSHAKNNLSIQEYMAVASVPESFSSSIEKLKNFYEKLGDCLRAEKGIENLAKGDEGGYSLDFKDNFEPVRIMEDLILKSGLENEFALALDAAASSFYGNGKYEFQGEKVFSEELLIAYREYIKNSKLLFSIEDPFDEGDFSGFKAITREFVGKLVVGDDLTVTNPSLVEKFARENLINGVIIKPNQIGTLSEACEAMNVARKNGVKCIVSHRSGETEDAFIIHLAKAGGAYGVKIGAPVKERMSKFDELIKIYD